MDFSYQLKHGTGIYFCSAPWLESQVCFSERRKKLAATSNRCQGVCNLAGEPIMTFCGKGGAAA